MRLFIFSIISVLFFLYPGSTHTELHSQVWGLDELMQAMARVEKTRSTFTEKKYLTLLKEPMELSGELVYVRGKKIEKKVYKPHVEIYSIHGEEVTYINEKREINRNLNLDDHPELKAFIESLRSTLRGDLSVLKEHYNVTFEGVPRFWLLRLTPRGGRLKDRIKDIELQGSKTKIRGVEIRETTGDRSEMLIKDHVQELK